MIPKVIHYCWFGKNPLPDEYLKYIDTWRKFCPDYKIIQWDESNYDVNKINFIKQAYDNKKYAFVSDYARLDIINKYGGVYFDTDIEVVKSFNDLLDNKAFGGLERVVNNYYLAFGLGFGSEKNNLFIQEIMHYYENKNFIKKDGSFDCTPIPEIVSSVLKDKYSVDVIKNEIIKLDNITIYPTEYFGCKDMINNKIKMTKNTYSIHHYSGTWKDKNSYIFLKLQNIFGKRIGEYIFVILNKIKRIIKL